MAIEDLKCLPNSVGCEAKLPPRNLADELTRTQKQKCVTVPETRDRLLSIYVLSFMYLSLSLSLSLSLAESCIRDEAPRTLPHSLTTSHALHQRDLWFNSEVCQPVMAFYMTPRAHTRPMHQAFVRMQEDKVRYGRKGSTSSSFSSRVLHNRGSRDSAAWPPVGRGCAFLET